MADNVEVVEVQDADVQDTEKVEVYYVDADGTRTLKGRGRPRLGYVQKDDGNFHADPNFDRKSHKATQVKPVVDHFYVTFDESGTEISREKVGRGRPKKDFVRQDNGDFHSTPAAETSADAVAVADTLEQDVEVVVVDEEVNTDSIELTDEAVADETPVMVDDSITE